MLGAIVLVLSGALNIMSGLFLRRRHHRMASIVITGFNCLQIPFGMALGIFTILVLSRDSVRSTYKAPLP